MSTEPMFAGEVIKRAKNHPAFDEMGAITLSDTFGVSYEFALQEIKFVRKNLKLIEG